MTKGLGKAETIKLLKQGGILIFMKGLHASFYMSGTLDAVPLRTAFSLIDSGIVKMSKDDWRSTYYIINNKYI